MLEHFSRNIFFPIFDLGNIFENFDQKMAQIRFFGKKSGFLPFLIKIVKSIA